MGQGEESGWRVEESAFLREMSRGGEDRLGMTEPPRYIVDHFLNKILDDTLYIPTRRAMKYDNINIENEVFFSEYVA